MKITPKNSFFIQQQNIFYTGSLQSDTTLVYGLGNNREIGINAYNFFWHFGKNDISEDISEELKKNSDFYVSPNLTMNYQERFDLNHRVSLSYGGKFGIEAIPKPSGFPTLGYILTRWAFWNEKVLIFSGAFFGNSAYLGKFRTKQTANNSIEQAIADYSLGGLNYLGYGIYSKSHLIRINQYGVMGGMEIEISPKKFHLLMDGYSGVHSLGISVYGFSYFFSEIFFLNMGWQVPNRKGGLANPHAILLELNYSF